MGTTPFPNPIPDLDVAGLMRTALGEQQPGEEIETALRRMFPGKDPAGEEKIYQVICEFLKMMEWRQGISRQESAKQLADSECHMKVMPDGTPFLETFAVNVKGLESLLPEQREQALQQIRESLAQGKLPRTVIQTNVPMPGRSLVVLVIAVLSGLLVAYLFSR